MDKRGANIDLVFRNGLKDFEVIPPPDVWDNIRPVIKTKHRPVFLIRTAASIAVILTLSFLAYELNRQLSATTEGSVVAVNQVPVTSDAIPSYDSPVNIPRGRSNNSPVLISSDEIAAQVNADKNDVLTATPDVYYLQETNRLSAGSSIPRQALNLASLNQSQKNSFRIKEPDLQYPQVIIPQKGAERWTIAALASPTYYSQMGSGGTQYVQQLAASEQPLISYSGGVAFSYKISKRLSVQSGLYYSSLGQEVEGINSFTGFRPYDNTKGDHNFEVATTNGTIYTNNTDVFLLASGPVERISTSFTNDVFDPKKANLQYINNTLHQTFSYVEMPVLVRYKFIDKTIDFNLVGGVSYNLLVNNLVYTVVDGSRINVGETEGLNLITVSSSLGMGMEYNISQKLSLNLEPTFRYYLNPVSGTTASTHPYSFGIFSGVSYRF